MPQFNCQSCKALAYEVAMNDPHIPSGVVVFRKFKDDLGFDFKMGDRVYTTAAIPGNSKELPYDSYSRNPGESEKYLAIESKFEVLDERSTKTLPPVPYHRTYTIAVRYTPLDPHYPPIVMRFNSLVEPVWGNPMFNPQGRDFLKERYPTLKVGAKQPVRVQTKTIRVYEDTATKPLVCDALEEIPHYDALEEIPHYAH